MSKKRKNMYLPVLLTLFVALSMTPVIVFADISDNDNMISDGNRIATVSNISKTEDVEKEGTDVEKTHDEEENGYAPANDYDLRNVSAVPSPGKIIVNTTVVNHITDYQFTGTIDLNKNQAYTATFSHEKEFWKNCLYFLLEEGSENELVLASEHQKDSAILKLETKNKSNEYTFTYLGDAISENIQYFIGNSALYTHFTGSRLTYTGMTTTPEGGDSIINEIRDDYYSCFIFDLTVNVIGEKDAAETENSGTDQNNKNENGDKNDSGVTNVNKDRNDNNDENYDRYYASQWVKDSCGWKYYSEKGYRLSGSVSILSDGVRREKYAWIKIHNTWWPFAADGYLKTGWILDANDNKWYLIDENTGMKTGWYLDAERNNTSYYLHPENGSMVTGWRFIDGKWYYFSEIDDSTYGAMYYDSITPDGYRVDATGAWDGNFMR